MIYFVSSGRQHLNSISLCLYSGQWNSVCVCVCACVCLCNGYRVMRKTWTLLQHRQKKDLRLTRMSKCQMTAFSFDDKVTRLIYWPCSAEVLAPYAIATQRCPPFTVHVISATFSLPLRLSLTLWERFVQRWWFSVTIRTLTLPVICSLVCDVANYSQSLFLCWKCFCCCLSI